MAGIAEGTFPVDADEAALQVHRTVMDRLELFTWPADPHGHRRTDRVPVIEPQGALQLETDQVDAVNQPVDPGEGLLFESSAQEPFRAWAVPGGIDSNTAIELPGARDSLELCGLAIRAAEPQLLAELLEFKSQPGRGGAIRYVLEKDHAEAKEVPEGPGKL